MKIREIKKLKKQGLQIEKIEAEKIAKKELEITNLKEKESASKKRSAVGTLNKNKRPLKKE